MDTTEDPSSHGDAPVRVGPYLLGGRLGEGGMGEVWRATDTRLGRVVALKCIHAALQARPRTRARFWNEARALATLDDPAFARIHELGETDDGRMFIAMELIEGEPLSKAMEGASPPTPEEALTGLAALAEALGRAHDKGIIHRDIKPSNILREASGRLRLVDFGLVRYLGDEDPGLSVDGAVVGTLQWMAPEQIAGEALSPATDVFQLGLVLATLLTGRHPFARDSAEATAAAILTCGEARVGVSLPAEVRALLSDCLSRAPSARPADGPALAVRLRAVRNVSFQPISFRAAAEPHAVGTGTEHRPASAPAGTRRTRAWPMLGMLTLAAAGVALAMSVGGTVGSGSEGVELEAEIPVDTGVALLRALSEWPRPRVALAPLVTSPHGEATAFGVIEAMRRDLARDSERLALLPASSTLALGGSDAAAPGPDAAAQLSVETWITAARRGVTLSTRDARGAWRIHGMEEARRVDDAPEQDATRLAAMIREGLGLPARPPPENARTSAIDAEFARAERALHDFHTRTFARRVGRLRELAPDHPLTLLLDGERAFGLGRFDEARRRFESVIEKAGDDARLASEAGYRLAALPGAAPGIHAERVEAHLERWPGDLQAHLEQLNLYSRTPVSHGADARATARRILARWPDTPFAASRLLRSLAWQGAHAAAGAVVEGLDGRVGDSSIALLMGEHLVHAGRYDEAIEWLEGAVEEDGRPGYYAAHLRMAALILGGRCAEGAVTARAELDEAATMPDRHEPTWTHILWMNALICAGRLEEAGDAIARWEERFPASDAAPYARDLRWRVRRLANPVDAAMLAELEQDALRGLDVARWLYMLEARDPARLEALAEAIDAAEAERAPTHRFQAKRVSWLSSVCRARVKVLRGDVDAGLLELEALTAPEIFSEGDLYRRVDALRLFATSLETAGYPDAAADVWRRILGESWARVQRMDAAVDASRRLCLVGLGRAAAR